jgi:hypothetical protein
MPQTFCAEQTSRSTTNYNYTFAGFWHEVLEHLRKKARGTLHDGRGGFRIFDEKERREY